MGALKHFIPVLLLLAVSCQKQKVEILPMEWPEDPITVDEVQVEDDTPLCDTINTVLGRFDKDAFYVDDQFRTKAEFDDPDDLVLNLCWEKGDAVYVFNRKAYYYINKTKVVILNYNRVKFQVDSVMADGTAIFVPEAGADMSVFDPDHGTYYACMSPSISTPTGFLFDKDIIQSGFPSQNYVKPGSLHSDSFQVVSKAKLSEDGTLSFEFHPVTCYLKVVVPEGRTVRKIRVVKSDVCSVRLSCYYQIELNPDGTFYRGIRGNGTFTGSEPTVSGAANISYNYQTDRGVKTSFPAGTYYLPFCTDGSFKAIDVFKTDSAYDTYPTPQVVYGEKGKVIDLTDLIPAL